MIHHILSREVTDSPANFGRIDEEKCEQLSKGLLQIDKYDHIYICGPEQMIFSVRDWLYKRGVSKDKVHFELFTIPGERKVVQRYSTVDTQITSTVKLKLDGLLITYKLPFDGSSILDGALKQGADLPYACKGGVCATCRAKLISGKVEMDNNYALEEDELAAGYILTCQSHPRTEEVEIDFDDHRT
jgi:ring-1,2-phenylacetyl-CoA epoxidase subunit PaaE